MRISSQVMCFAAKSYVLLLAGLLLASCMSSKGVVRVSSDEPNASWLDVVKNHTRRDEYYHYSNREADLRATLVTPNLRRAFIQNRENFHGRASAEFASEVVTLGARPHDEFDGPNHEAAEVEAQVVIFVAFYAAQQRFRGLRSTDTQWDILLSRNGSSHAPTTIERLRFSPALKDILPHLDRFDDVYILRFPFMDEAGKPFFTTDEHPLVLEIKSVVADLKVEWTLKE